MRPNTAVTVRVLNGTFTSSVSAVTADRVRDVSVVRPGGVTRLDTTTWRAQGDTTLLSVTTGGAGTYLVGASVQPRVLRLAAKDFNKYLGADGVPDVLAARRRDGELDAPSRERYSKHVTALLQVGDERTAGYQTQLGYPAELVAVDNPYALRPGATLHVRALVDGKPVANQYVVAGGRTPGGARIATQSVRTDPTGVARIRLGARGQWYVKFIHMVRLQGDAEADYESKWATLTFEVR